MVLILNFLWSLQVLNSKMPVDVSLKEPLSPQEAVRKGEIRTGSEASGLKFPWAAAACRLSIKSLEVRTIERRERKGFCEQQGTGWRTGWLLRNMLKSKNVNAKCKVCPCSEGGGGGEASGNIKGALSLLSGTLRS